MRTILEVWPEELKKLQDTYYNMNYDEDIPRAMPDHAGGNSNAFKFNPAFFTGSDNPRNP